VRIEEVHAYAFGPFTNETLTLAPGMNVIHGANEAGKSSWHAALFAGICGMARRRGSATREDAAFRDRHAPWDATMWQVGAIITLEDGRRIHLRHDLHGRVDCRAVDATLGRDCSHEIMLDGAPDASHWLGLDRRSFLAIACVRQADLLGVLERPDLLKEYLQRAADSLSQDSSVAMAISRIDDYRQEHVGRDAMHAVRPLRRARDGFERAQAHLAAAQSAHADYVALEGEVAVLAHEASSADRDLKRIQATRSQVAARASARRLARARELAARHPHGPPPSLAADDALARQIATALHDWNTRPREMVLTGETASDLKARLAALPEMPEGDLDPHPDVQAAAHHYDLARQRLSFHEGQRPQDLPQPDAGGATAGELRRLASVLAQPRPVSDAGNERHDTQATHATTTSVDGRKRPLLIAGGLVAALGLAVALRGPLIVGIILLALSVALVYGSLRARSDVARAQETDQPYDANLLAHQQWRAPTISRLHDLGLPLDADVLERLATQCDAAQQSQQELQRWDSTRRAILQELGSAQSALGAALRSRGVSENGSVETARATYVHATTERRQTATMAGKRAELERRVNERIGLERAAADTAERRTMAGDQLRAAARAAGVAGDEPDELVQACLMWQERRGRDLRAREASLTSFEELRNVLGGGTLDDLTAQARYDAETAARLLDGLDDDVVATTVLESDAEAQEQRLLCRAQTSREALGLKRGQLEERRRTLPPVSEAEEAVAAARAEFDRVRQLDETLTLTRDFLEKAQQHVHQSVAPVLAGGVRRWLPTITAGRYTDVRVDPANLDVQVLAPDGHWRRAALLSHGTAEQIYLLLRLTLAQHLTKQNEVCPLILDDVTVHCDAERKCAVLQTLHGISRERQVVVFTQEDAVLAWARAHCQTPRDRVIPLPPLAVVASSRAAS